MPVKEIIDTISLWALPAMILTILAAAVIKKVPVYETFIEGAKDGSRVCFNILPYLAAIIVSIAMFRASGILDGLSSLAGSFLDKYLPADVLPLAVVRSLSGSAALGVFSDIVSNNDVNSYASKLAAVMLGSSETTFYVLAVYFGAIGIKKYRYAVLTGITADCIGIIMAVIVTRFFFGG